MTIPAGAPTLTLFPNTPTFQLGSAKVALACDPDPMEPSAPQAKIAQQDTDGSWKQIAAFDITGIMASDPGLALASVFNKLGIGGRANWDGPSAQTLANTTPVAQLVALIVPWFNSDLGPQYASVLTQLFGGTFMTPAPTATNISLVDLIRQLLLGAVVNTSPSGAITVTHP